MDKAHLSHLLQASQCMRPIPAHGQGGTTPEMEISITSSHVPGREAAAAEANVGASYVWAQITGHGSEPASTLVEGLQAGHGGRGEDECFQGRGTWEKRRRMFITSFVLGMGA